MKQNSAALPLAAQEHSATPIARWLVLLLAVACAVVVGNLYYAQPVLPAIARGFKVSEAAVGPVATLTQLGYAAGLLLIVPLGDTRDRRRMIVLALCASAIALVAVALAPSLLLLMVACFVVGALSVSAQIILPFAASLAAPNERGRVVGTIMSGLLIGILLARTVSGFVSAALGWRAIFWIAAGAMLLLAAVLRSTLPADPARPGLSYGQLLRSLWGLLRELPALRETCVFGGLVFGAFSAFWVTLAFFLETPPYAYGSDVVGLFGLVGVAGALAASFAGRLSDRMPARRIAGVGIAILAASFGVYWLLGGGLWGIALGVVLMDLGTQTAHVANQTRVYALIPEARSRLNTIYIVSYFLGGAAGSTLGVAAWSAFGWAGVCALGAGLGLAALGLWLVGREW